MCQSPIGLDVAFAWQASRHPLFEDGWGDEGLLGQATGALFLEGPRPKAVEVRWEGQTARGGLLVKEGRFASPQSGLPQGVETAYLRWVTPARGPGHSACLILAGSREEGFALREAVYGPLVHTGVDLLLLENPFAGKRRGPGQQSAAVRTVSDHLLLNLAMGREAEALLGWLGRAGYRRRGVAGYSMGGFMAALVAARTPEPLAVAALAAGTTPAPVFTKGLLARSVDFSRLGQASGGEEGARARLASLFGLADVLRLPVVARPSAAVVVGCLKDGYVRAEDTRALAAHWPQSQLRWLQAGHVSAVLFHRAALRAAVAEAFRGLWQGPSG